MKNQKIEVPISALLLNSKDKRSVSIDEQDHLDMVIYSGGTIKDHYYWDNLAIDLEGMSFPKKKYPILQSHDVSQKIAYTGKPSVNGNLTIDSESTVFVDTPASTEFRRLSKEGFPYESSMYARPTVIERIEEGAAVEVNGMTVKGPATVWRKSIFKEASICVFGFDPQTSATAFSKDILELAVDVQGFDADDVLATRLFNLTQGGQPQEREAALSSEDQATVDQLLSLADNADDLHLHNENGDLDDDALAEKLFKSTGGNLKS